MKTLVNKNNPQIRITAPEIEVQEESEMYLIPVSDYCIPMCIDDWTLVEEEPVEQTSKYLQKPDYDERVVKKMSKELAKLITDQIAEPMDLEEEIEKWITPSNPSIDPKKGTISREVYIDCIIVTARHFYELGKKGGINMIIVDSDYNHEIWNTTKFTFIGYCKCKYCGEEFYGRFVEAAHEYIKCPNCGRSLSWGER